MTCSVDLTLDIGIFGDKFGIDFGLSSWNDEFEIINLDDVIPNPILDVCYPLSYSLDRLFQEDICTCESVVDPDPDTETDTVNDYFGDLCVIGETRINRRTSQGDVVYIQGDYNYGGNDSNDNDYWIMSYNEGQDCNLYNHFDNFYICKSEDYNAFQISIVKIC